jgi:DNA invertase Pin-like site-specific DNA recombinase
MQITGDGFPRQREAITKYAEFNDIEVVAWYEEDISGTKDLSNRPVLQKLLLQLYLGEVTLVLIERMDRLARDLMVQENIIQDIHKHRCEIVSVMEPDLCRDDPTRKLMRQIFGAIADYDRSMINMKLRAGLKRARAAGRVEGRKPYPDPRRPGEQEISIKINEMYEAGMKYHHIAEALNAEEIPTRYMKQWAANTVRSIIRRSLAS